MGRGDSVKRGGRFERAGGRLTLNPRAEPVEWGARKASRRSSVAARTKSPGGTTRQYSARDHRECTRSVSPRPRLVSFRLASFFRSRFVPKVNFSIERIRVYTYPGEKSEFIRPPSDLSSDSYPPFPALFFYLLYLYTDRRKPTHVALSNVARENNSTPR